MSSMLCVPRGEVEKSAQSRSKEIDRLLAGDKQVLDNQVQLLLLGRPGAGKSTLVKQLRLKNGDVFTQVLDKQVQFLPGAGKTRTSLARQLRLKNAVGFTQDELDVARMALLENLWDAMRAVLATRDELVLPWVSEQAEEDALLLTCRPLSALLSLKGWKGVTSMLVRLWCEDGVRKTWERSSAAGMPPMEWLPMFLEDPLRLCDQNYVPTSRDMLHIYRVTRGVSDCSVKGEACFRLLEMGGRSLTTPKLLHFFDNVNAVMFVASCCDVERRLHDGELTSGFRETCDFFSLVAKDPSLMRVPIILLITKLDVLMAKAQRLDLRAELPEIKGDPHNVKDVKRGLEEVFRVRCGSRPLYHHFMNCTDLKSVQDVFVEIKRDIRDSLLRKLLPQLR